MRYGRSALLAVAVLASIALVLSPVGSEAGRYLSQLPSEAVTLGSSFETLFPGAIPVGTPPSNTTLSVGVSLPGADPGGLSTFSNEVSDPGSPQYHHFLSPAEFSQRFSPSAGSYTAAEHYFQGYGLKVFPTANRLLLGVSGDSSDVGAAFHTTFSDYLLPDGSVHYGPESPPTTPTALGITAASGFTDAFDAKPSGLTPLLSLHPTATCPTSLLTGSGSIQTYTPSEIQGAYGVSSLLGAGNGGSGETVGIVDVYDSQEPQVQLASDLSTFSSDCALPAASVSYAYPLSWSGYNSSSTNGWGSEEVLDMDWAHSIAPDASLAMAFSPDSSNVFLDIAVDWLVERGQVNTISLSWGGDDIYAAQGGAYAIGHPIYEAAAAEGISVFSSSGDCGAAEGTNTVTTLYPASDSYVTGVGATNLSLTGSSTYLSESGWGGNESGSCSNNGGSGGGWAPTPRPWYQHGTGVASKNLRGVPDVSMDGGSGDPLDIVYGGSFGAAWGTSAASPQWAALAALADQMHGGDLGLLNPTIYGILRGASYTSYFHDVTSGNNGYGAGIGWDPITGVGTPIAPALVPVLANGAYLPSQSGISVTLTATSGGGSTEDFSASASGGSGGYLYSFNFGDGNGTTTSSATTTWTYTLNREYFANVVVYDSSGNASVSNFVGIAMGTLAMTASVSVSSTSVTVGQSVTFTASASGGTPSYFYDYFFGDGTSDGIVWDGWEAMGYSSTSHAYKTAGTYQAQILTIDSATPFDGAVSTPVIITVTAAVSNGPAITSFAATPNPISLGSSTSLAVVSSGGTAPLSYAYSNLPTGCTTSNTATLSCTPTAAGTSLVQVTVTDSASRSVSRNTSLTVSSANSLGVNSFTATPNPATAGKVVQFSVSASGGTAPLSYVYLGLPWGCTTSNTPNLSCTPGSNVTGTFSVEVKVSDASSKVASSTLTLTVNSPGNGGGGSNNTPFYETTMFYLIVVILIAVIIVAAVVSSRSGRSSQGSPSQAVPPSPAPPYPSSPQAAWPSPPPPPPYGGPVPPPPPGSSPVAEWASHGPLPPRPPAIVPPGAAAVPPPETTFAPSLASPPHPPRADAFCHNCGSPVDATHRFCEHCGTQLESPAPEADVAPTPTSKSSPVLCPGCGAATEPDAAFCMNCGHAIPRGGT